MRAAALVLAALAAVAHGAASGREPRAASTMRATLLCVLGAGLVRGAPRPLRRGLDAQLALIERDVAELERMDEDALKNSAKPIVTIQNGGRRTNVANACCEGTGDATLHKGGDVRLQEPKGGTKFQYLAALIPCVLSQEW